MRRLNELRQTKGAAERVVPPFLAWLLTDEEYGIIQIRQNDDRTKALLQEAIDLFKQKCKDACLWEGIRDRGYERLLDPSEEKQDDNFLQAATYAGEAMASFLQRGPTAAKTLSAAELVRKCAGMAITKAEPGVNLLDIYKIQEEKLGELLEQLPEVW